MDIAATVNPATVLFRSLSEPARVSVLEQNYEYDLLEPEKLLRKYVGRDVTLVRTRQVNGTTEEEEVTARLLSYNTQPVWRINGEIVTGLHADHIRFPELPTTLYAADIDLDARERRRVAPSGGGRVSCQQAVVERRLRADGCARRQGGRHRWMGDADQWQRHGISQCEAAAGRRRAQSRAAEHRQNAGGRPMAPRRELSAAPMAQEAFSEYHLYTLARKTTINNNETKQVSMLAGTGFPVQKRYVVNGNQFYYHNGARPGAPIKDSVEVFYQFKNEEKGGLGMPMPAGTVRVYQSDSNGGVQFVGEDRIAHTPKDEVLNLKIGNAFDVVCERNQVDFQKIAANVYEIEYAITLRNHKTTPITVEVNEPIGAPPGACCSATHKWTRQRPSRRSSRCRWKPARKQC